MDNERKTKLMYFGVAAVVVLIVLIIVKVSFIRSIYESKKPLSVQTKTQTFDNLPADNTKQPVIEPTNEAPVYTTEADATETGSIDAEAYYEKNSEVIASYDVKTSESIQTERQAVDDLSGRDFTQNPVTYTYSISGEYIGEHTATNGEEQHPIYQTFYTSKNDEFWTIISVNGSVIANPVSYNIVSGKGVQFIIAESNVVTSYSSTKNVFYETIPNESELIVHVVDKINAETLDALTVDAISGL